MNTYNIVLVRCPQPLLIGKETGALYSPNRSLTPEPTLPQLEGILLDFANKNDIQVKVTQFDLRDPFNGKISKVQYGELTLPYIKEKIVKIYHGVDILEKLEELKKADVIGFTNNFAMSRRVVANHISKIRKLFPKKEIWIGGRDLFTTRVKNVYAQAASGNCIIFDGHVFESLPAYLTWKLKGTGKLFGITIYADGQINKISSRPLTVSAKNQIIEIPLPIYKNTKSLGYCTGSGEGNPFNGRFVHMSISIGCPFNCGYCTTGYREKYLVRKSMDNIKAELDMYKKLGVKIIAIMDDNLLALGNQKVIEIMELINSYDFLIEYGNGLMLSSLTGDNWGKIAEPIFKNCISLYAPLEDLTEDCMYNKLAPINKELELMKKIANAKFTNLKYVTMGVILGVPGHTKKKLEDNFMSNMKKFLKVFSASPLEVAITVFNYMALPGTKFGEDALNSGRMVVDDPFYADPEVCSFGTTSYAPKNMSHKEVFELYEKALNMNPAGKKLGVTYTQLQRFGENAINQKEKMPKKWLIPGFHLRASMK